AADVFMAHSLRGLVQQHEFWVHGERGGDLQCTLATIRQVHGGFLGKILEVDLGKQFAGAVVQLVEHLIAAPEMEGKAGAALQADADVLQHGELGKDGGDLEGTDDAAPRNVGGSLASDFLRSEEHTSELQSRENLVCRL